MLSRFLHRRNMSSGSGNHNSSHQNTKGKIKSTQMTLKVQNDHEGAIKRQGEEETFASGMPTDFPGLSDKIDTHRRGNLFKYAVITNKPSEERSGFFSRLRTFKPQVQESVMTLSEIKAIRLIGEAVEFDLSMAMSTTELENLGDYVLIDSILIHYIPLDSFANDKSVVTIQVNDFRKLGNTVARSCKVDSTMGYNILFTLDYCVEKRDIRRMTVSFANHSKEFQEGVAWGAVKIVAQIVGLSFPKRVPLVDTMGVMLFADSDLQPFECDPRSLDLIITPEALKRLRILHEQGEIENKTIPLSDKKDIATARTIIEFDDEEEAVDSHIQKLKEMGLKKNKEHENVRSILKRNSNLLEMRSKEVDPEIDKSISEREEDAGAYDKLQDVEVGESLSCHENLPIELDEEIKRSVGFKNLKTVG
jgi:O6-methylguanine-DNA--protein-cysteine methyltransferase